MKPQASIEFTSQEADILLNLLNLSVKNIGISDGGATAQNATYFFKKITDAFQDKQVEKKETVKKSK